LHPRQIIDSSKAAASLAAVTTDTIDDAAKNNLPGSYFGKADTIL